MRKILTILFTLVIVINGLTSNISANVINISEENLTRVWNRFFKADEARNRDNGGSGIGLSIVRAIMNNYGNDFGVINKENGVEFYFELPR